MDADSSRRQADLPLRIATERGLVPTAPRHGIGMTSARSGHSGLEGSHVSFGGRRTLPADECSEDPGCEPDYAVVVVEPVLQRLALL